MRSRRAAGALGGPASAKATAARRSFSEGGSGTGQGGRDSRRRPRPAPAPRPQGFAVVGRASHHRTAALGAAGDLEFDWESLRVEEIGPGELTTYDKDGPMFVNVNTPHDHERAKDLMGRGPGSRENAR